MFLIAAHLLFTLIYKVVLLLYCYLRWKCFIFMNYFVSVKIWNIYISIYNKPILWKQVWFEEFVLWMQPLIIYRCEQSVERLDMHVAFKPVTFSLACLATKVNDKVLITYNPMHSRVEYFDWWPRAASYSSGEVNGN